MMRDLTEDDPRGLARSATMTLQAGITETTETDTKTTEGS
jgi:hypothetical protein